MSRLLYVLVVLMSLGGCASFHGGAQQRMDTFPEHYVQFDAALSWQVRRFGPDLVIDGLFKNLRYDNMNNVEVWVAVIDPAGKTTARSVGLLLPSAIPLNGTAPFTVTLSTKPAPGSKLRFSYRYAALSGAGPEGGGDTGFWMQSFDANIPASNE